MAFMFPYSGLMRIVGRMLLLTTLINTLLFFQNVMVWDHAIYSQWYFDWSWIFIFFGILLLLGSLWTDPRIVLVVSGIIAVLWYVYIIRGGW